ncbi:MAG: methyltransferase domain-containing protein, partial [Nitrospinaceae bacterium]|nr:methyltransferase domain-containing protein [Nitrospinaceae bacterium]NIR56765.1 methyltransferase domain-containing protein [Nitrospinaceae bacterium]NIS87216.1 methyltransferase domain-containing protein [Nitrospinaceae bacterium]NIT84086.1 methyltransferase domain-containing protein [Nitrospinaceae bacterium]NIU46265.1 methyltransferase domain-containing protein [Nitrospinaceae bacterium]
MNLYEELKNQEQVRIRYWRERDYFLPLRLKWRAQMVRHLFHLFPGETILELGCAAGEWTREVSAANHDTNPIHAATLDPSCFEDLQNSGLSKNIEPLLLQDFPGPLKDRQYDFIIGWHLMNDRTCGLFLKEIKKLLKPGGGLLLFEPNPWNPYRGLRRF